MHKLIGNHMRLFSTALAVALFAIAAVPSATADTLASYTAGLMKNNIYGYYFELQITTAPGLPEDHLVFNFYSDVPASTPTASGTLYLLNTFYGGTPSGLSPSVTGYLGQASGSGSYYTFPTTITLQPGTTYYVVLDGNSAQTLFSYGQISPGTSWMVPHYSDLYSNPTVTWAMPNYRLTGSSAAAVPEPGAGLLTLIGIGSGWVMRKRIAKGI